MLKISQAVALPLMLFSVVGLSGCQGRSSETTATSVQNELPVSEAGLNQVALSIRTTDATHAFIVEVAESGAQQAQGLMFRTRLAPDKGMIFPFTEDRVASFWMKNTVIPLDIIFIRRNGTIESIAADTIPYSLAPVRSNEPIATVLEIAAGRAAELGIKPGDTVAWQ
ncbi:DUF192 domain-containing protein [Sphingorhabdus sp. M41]|uniref:DUF192 domain-containing protein n=1 Tax=Sphingorhabdus sp. M41 TaxID=1806885 RepID=UPI00078C4F64|nr:DUF192 domain-containing protein [Sphingorhabdus sp. M41]AMO70788.1 hypothetical protein AZE99_01975 [Sphingorhabdus sp. M41]